MMLKGMAYQLKQTTVVLDIFYVFLSAAVVYSYNIDLEHHLVFRGPNSSFFGYSVLEHFHDNTRWVLVGAPKASSIYSGSVHTPGAVFKCRVHSNPERRCTEMDLGRGNKLRESCGKTCQGDRDDEWMGVSLARQDKPNGKILACAHRWKNVYYDTEHILPHGYCSIVPPSLQGRTRPLIPCYEDYKQKYGEEHGSCQAGIAGVFTEELVIMGAPGSYYWTGTVKVYNLTSGTLYNPNREEVDSHRYSYLGYAVTAGHFSSHNVIDVAAGAPQHSGAGKVYIFKIDGSSLVKIFQASGEMKGELLYNLTADVDKRQKSQPSRVYFAQNGAQISSLRHQLSLEINREECQSYTAYVKKDVKDVFTAITFEVAYSLGKHVLDGSTDADLPALSPVLRWRKGDKIAARNETWFEKNCLSDDCAADLRLHGKLLLSGVHSMHHFALGGVKNISLNLTISNAGDDAYDTNIYFNFSREVFYINFWQKEEKGISCGLVDLDFLKCSVGFPFMRAQTKYHLAVIFDTSRLSGENETLQFLIHAKSANPEHKTQDNTLNLSIPLVHEVDTTLTGVVTPTSFVYGNSIDHSRFVQMDDMECNFQPLNFTFQVINNGPSRLPGSIMDIRIPNRLAGNGPDMFHIMDTQVTDNRGNCTLHRNPMPCTIPQDRENIFHTIFAFFTKSGRRVLDCDRPGRACLTISCSLGSQSKEEALNIDVQLLLNTEILKRDSSSVIQFVTRGNVQVDGRAMEKPNGLTEEISLVFEALHSQEPRGYVVGWIIAISLLVGILIFLLLAVLLWKMGFFRRRYREIIEAEKNRDSDESWDWVEKNH
ncbi:integrin alpha-9 [Aplochiton taeniatus]